METVLQLIDVKTAYSTFTKSFEIHTGSQTLIVDHPNTCETRSLLTYVHRNVASAATEMAEEHIDLASITTVMTCQQINDLCSSEADASATALYERKRQFTAVVYGLVTKFDLDGSAPVVVRRW